MNPKLHETRQKIIDHLKEKEEATVEELATVVDLTPMAVRYHLNVLQSENLIHTSEVRRQTVGRGRPQQIYKLSDAADDLFPVDYYSLTDYLLDELSEQLGPEGVNSLFHRIAQRLAKEAPPAAKNQTIEERLDDVVDFLSEKGFVLDWEINNNNYLIHAYSCPYRQLAKEYSDVCLLDKQVITAMLEIDPTRTACLSAGDNHCTYQISAPIDLLVPG